MQVYIKAEVAAEARHDRDHARVQRRTRGQAVLLLAPAPHVLHHRPRQHGYARPAEDVAGAQIDFEFEQVTVAAYCGENRVQISTPFESFHDRLAAKENNTLLAFVGEDEVSLVLPAPEVPGFGEGLYASLGTIEAQLQGGGAKAFLAEAESS